MTGRADGQRDWNRTLQARRLVLDADTATRYTDIDRRVAMESLVACQNQVSAEDRDLLATALAALTNRIVDNPYHGARNPPLLHALEHVGVAGFPGGLSEDVCGHVRRYFGETPCYNAHVPSLSDGRGRSPNDEARQWNYGSYTLEQSLDAPHILEFALNDELLDVVGGYLGCVPTLYSINTFWTFPHPGGGQTHDYHRDEDDYRFVAVFIYWTEVSPGEGEIFFIPGTHDYRQMDRYITGKRRSLGQRWRLRSIRTFDELRRMTGNGYERGRLYDSLFGTNVTTITGGPGSVFLCDTFGLHRGSVPRSRPRLTTWIRYGLFPNEAFHADGTRAVPSSRLRGRLDVDDRTKFICRLIIDP